MFRDMSYQAHRDLIAWQKGKQLTVASYRVAKLLPAEERFELSSQIRRAAVSVPCNIAEGKGRITGRDYAHFLSMGRGSVYELDTCFDLAIECCGLSPRHLVTARGLGDEVARMLTTMIKGLHHP